LYTVSQQLTSYHRGSSTMVNQKSIILLIKAAALDPMQ
jgi:hypothetical protein